MNDVVRHPWFVVETLSRKEMFAVENLERQGFECFYPRFHKVRRHARREDVVLASLFPGYIFVRFLPGQQPWRSINGTFGVKRLVCFDGLLPPSMPDPVIQLLQQRCPEGVMTQLLDIFVPGQEVRMAYGPFADMVGRIESLDDKGRISVLMHWLGRELTVKLKPDCLLPL